MSFPAYENPNFFKSLYYPHYLSESGRLINSPEHKKMNICIASVQTLRIAKLLNS